MKTSIRAVAAVVLLAVSMTACGALDGYPVPTDTVTDTLMPGWESHYALAWSVDRDRHGETRIDGYVVNRDGTTAEPVRLLAQALDPSGAVVAQRIAVVHGGVGGFGRAYFELRELPAADWYRVTVWDYQRIES